MKGLEPHFWNFAKKFYRDVRKFRNSKKGFLLLPKFCQRHLIFQRRFQKPASFLRKKSFPKILRSFENVAPVSGCVTLICTQHSFVQHDFIDDYVLQLTLTMATCTLKKPFRLQSRLHWGLEMPTDQKLYKVNASYHAVLVNKFWQLYVPNLAQNGDSFFSVKNPQYLWNGAR